MMDRYPPRGIPLVTLKPTINKSGHDNLTWIDKLGHLNE